ncbi:hypothetical protein NS183_08060 [Microbacterium testaceum]|uniref:NAD-dependent epimerase/dehydratase family protein n=1 Tax=Microbacterium testaceum TaxID=2033 RepID=UPI000734B2A2|nr:NAD(P)-dependent oxidoreductase [Microbacterium testaceum]KTS90603.1 hypothetical protein NS183_08060 [Microbacterium testaceum]
MTTFRRVLVTGAAGRLGSAVVAALAEKGVQATGLDRRPADGPDRMVVADATDQSGVDRAFEDVDAVIHAAALASPTLAPPVELFTSNSVSTFTVLEAAVRHGVRRIAFASSFSITGLPRGSQRPSFLPIDESSPLQIEDVYALTKQVDECSGRMLAAASGASITALRFPLLGSPDRELRAAVERYLVDEGSGAGDLWSYLDTRDAAAAMVRALERAQPGFRALYVAAPTTLAQRPTEDLLDRWLPGVPRGRVFPGRETPISTDAARAHLGFEPVHVLDPARLRERA